MSDDADRVESKHEVIGPIEEIPGRYSNFMRVGHGPAEFRLDFCAVEDLATAHLLARIVISPLRIKGFVRVLGDNVRRYEQTYGLTLPDELKDYVEAGIPKNSSQGNLP